MTLYRLICGLGTYFVIAEHPTQAQEKLEKILNDNDYGFDKDRVVTEIKSVATAIAIDNQFSLSSGHTLVL